MRKNLTLILAVLLIVLLAVSLFACKKVKGGEPKTDARQQAVDSFAGALIALGGEGWKLEMTEEERAALPDEAAYYIFRAAVQKLAKRIYDEDVLVNSKIDYYTELLRKPETVSYARDVADKTRGVNLLDILSGYEISADDFSSISFILMEMSYYDAEAAFDAAAADIGVAVVRGDALFGEYKRLSTDRARLTALSKLPEAEVPDHITTKELGEILSYIKEIDSGFAGSLGPGKPNYGHLELLLQGIESAKDFLIATELEKEENAVLKASIDAAQTAYEAYVEELSREEEDIDLENLAANGALLKEAIASSIEIDEETAAWRQPLKIQAELFIERQHLMMPLYKYLNMADNLENIKVSKEDYKAVISDAGFSESFETIMSNRESASKLLNFFYKTGKLLDTSLTGEIESGDLFDLSDKTAAEAVTMIKSFALAAKNLLDGFSDEELSEISAALGICAQPLVNLFNIRSISAGIDELIVGDAMPFFSMPVGYGSLVELAAKNFDILPLLLKLSYISGYYGIDELYVETVNAASKNDIDKAFTGVGAAKLLLSLVSGSGESDGISLEELKAEIAAYRARVYNAADPAAAISGNLELWKTVVSITNDLMALNEASVKIPDYIWLISDETYDALDDASILKTNLAVMVTEYAKGGVPGSNTKLTAAVIALKNKTGVAVNNTSQITAAEYAALKSAAEDMLLNKNADWFDALTKQGGDLDVIFGRLYSAENIALLGSIVSRFPTLASMQSADSAAISQLKADLKKVGIK